ncbi:MAG TPA: hypothetical protein VK402_08550 [Blastococcus sp.]|nr:hypothetical protein [Blastococcus sp.]
MTDPSQRDRGPSAATPPPADPTRDIRLPPLPDRPFPALPPEWKGDGRPQETPPPEIHAEPPAAEPRVAEAPAAESTVAEPTVAEPTAVEPPDAEPAEAPLPPVRGEPTTPRVGPLVDQPTDELGSPPPGAPRDPTLTFEGTAAQRWAAGLAATPDPVWSPLPQRPGPVVGPRPRPVPEKGRRWPWVLLVSLPVLIIVGTGIWLLLILRAA